MARRGREDISRAQSIAQLGGLLILIGMMSTGSAEFGRLAIQFIIGLSGIVVVVLLVLVWLKRQDRTQGDSFGSDVDASWPTGPTGGTPHPYPVMQPQSKTLDLGQCLRAIDWFQFERLIERMYQRLGYTVTRRGGANPDGGLDLIVERDGRRLGVQCKHWRATNVGVKTVREFVGALTDARIEQGVLITLCDYTQEARLLADRHRIELVSEGNLLQLLDTATIRQDGEAVALLRDTRKFCPKCENEMVLRTAGRGVKIGKRFWGCSAYPRCRFTMPSREPEG